MKPQKKKRYPLNQSPIYKLRSRKKALKLVGAPPNFEKTFVEPDFYKIFLLNGKRKVECPKPILQIIHKKIAKFLANIDPPEYLHSAVKGRSYITNAEQHKGQFPTVKVDIKKFFPSVKKVAIYNFFHDTMKCSPDVAGLLARITTIDAHLPTGSSVSPILSYYAHKPMFDAIHELAVSRRVLMTCYVDDMTFTGDAASRRFLYDVRKIINQHGLISHKTRLYGAKDTKLITGVAVSKSGISLPRHRWQSIKSGLTLLRAANHKIEKLQILPTLIGRLHEAAQINPSLRSQADDLSKLRVTLLSS